MKKLFSILLLLVSINSFSQVYQKENLYGKTMNRLEVLMNMAVPDDTTSVPTDKRNKPHFAIKDTVAYVWVPSMQKWVIAVGGGSSSGSGNYIQNQFSVKQSADFWNNKGRVDTWFGIDTVQYGTEKLTVKGASRFQGEVDVIQGWINLHGNPVRGSAITLNDGAGREGIVSIQSQGMYMGTTTQHDFYFGSGNLAKIGMKAGDPSPYFVQVSTDFPEVIFGGIVKPLGVDRFGKVNHYNFGYLTSDSLKAGKFGYRLGDMVYASYDPLDESKPDTLHVQYADRDSTDGGITYTQFGNFEDAYLFSQMFNTSTTPSNNAIWKYSTSTNKWELSTDATGSGVTSVNASISGALGVTGGPITGSGTLAFAWQGTSSQQVLGDGSLATKITDNNQLANGAGYLVAANLAAYVTLTGAETLSNKTLTSPILNGSSTTGYVWKATDNLGNGSWQADATGGGGGSSIFSDLIDATATNTINNGAFAQEWQWNSLAGATGLKLSSNSTASSGSGTHRIFEVANSGANATTGQLTYGAYFTNTKTGTSSTNVAAYFNASGATNNHAAHFDNGSVTIGTLSSPIYPLQVNLNQSAFVPGIMINNTSTNTVAYTQIAFNTNARTWGVGGGNNSETFFGVANKFFVYDQTANLMRLVIDPNGDIGNTTDPLAKLHITATSVGTTGSIANSLYLQNTTAATSGNQQNSPAIVLEGKGWKTVSTAASRAVAWMIDVLPVQGTTNPQSSLQFGASVNGGAFGNILDITDQGVGTMTGSWRATSNMAATSQITAGTTTIANTYRTTNGGSNVTPEIFVGNTTFTAGTLAYAIEQATGYKWLAANGTRQIARAEISLTNLTNTAGSEAADLIFKTQSGGTAASEKFRLTGAGAALFSALVGTGDRVVITSATGSISASTVTATELGYIDNVTSDIQTQLDSKWTALADPNAHRILGWDDTDGAYVNMILGTGLSYDAATNTLSAPGGGGGGSGTVNTGAANTLAYYPGAGTTVDDLAAITANRLLISDANGLPIASSVTSTQVTYLNNISSDVQTQIDGKSSTSHNHDHGGLTGLTDDDHAQYALLAGRSGGQTLIGGLNSGDDLLLSSTSNGTKGHIAFGSGALFDESTGSFKIGTTSAAISNRLVVEHTGAAEVMQIILRNGSASANSGSGIGFVVAGNTSAQTGSVGHTYDGTNYVTYLENYLGGGLKKFLKSTSAETVFNDDGIDLDFRIETDGNDNMIFVDGGSNEVRFVNATDNGAYPFQVNGDSYFSGNIFNSSGIGVTGGSIAITGVGGSVAYGLELRKQTQAASSPYTNSGLLWVDNSGDPYFSIGNPTVSKKILLDGDAFERSTTVDALTAYDDTYTPTLTNVSNVASSTVRGTRYMRVGNRVYVSGAVDITPTTGSGTATSFQLTLPIASNFTTAYDAAGTMTRASDEYEAGTIASDGSNDKVTFTFIAKAASPGSAIVTYTYSYTIQ